MKMTETLENLFDKQETLCNELQGYVSSMKLGKESVLSLRHPLLYCIMYSPQINALLNYQFKMIKSRVNDALKNNYKSSSALVLLDCSLEYLKLYLEKQFLPEMTWENYGLIWEIDHIKPCFIYDLTDLKQQQECFNYKNLQPLFKTTKIAKSLGYENYVGNRDKSKKF